MRMGACVVEVFVDFLGQSINIGQQMPLRGMRLYPSKRVMAALQQCDVFHVAQPYILYKDVCPSKRKKLIPEQPPATSPRPEH